MTATAREEVLVRDRIAQLLDELDPAATPVREFLARQFDLGLAFVTFPSGRGGLGVSGRWQRLIDEQLDARGATRAWAVNPLGVGMLAPTLVSHGTDEQIDRFLRPAFTGDELWCQLFSEPGAGSNLAGLATRAVPDGGDDAGWTVTGQKVWTSLAHKAYFLIDMHQPGVKVRPLRQLNGVAEFNEVFLDSARIPAANRLGGPGDGWRVAATTLTSERTALAGAATRKATIGGAGIDRLIDKALETGAWDDPIQRREVVWLALESTLAPTSATRWPRAVAARSAPRARQSR